MARKSTKEKIDYTTGFSQDALARTEEIASKVQGMNTIFYDVIRDIRETYRQNQQEHQNDPEKADRLFEDYKKKANFGLPNDIKTHIFDIAVNTADLSDRNTELFDEQQKNWQLRMAREKQLSLLPDREKLEDFLKCEEPPSEKEVKASLPPKPIKSIAPGVKLSEEHLKITEKLNLEESQQKFLHGWTKDLAKGEEKSTDHLIKALAYVSNEGVSSNKILKILNSTGKLAFKYEKNLLILKKDNENLNKKQEATQSQVDNLIAQMAELMAQKNTNITHPEIVTTVQKIPVGANN